MGLPWPPVGVGLSAGIGTAGTSVMHTLLLVGAIWAAAMLTVYLLVLPLLRSARRRDELLRDERRASLAAHALVAPVDAGYAGLVLQRLTVHTTTVLGANEVCLMVVQDHPPHRLVTVAEHGIGAEAILESPPPRHRVAWRALADGG